MNKQQAIITIADSTTISAAVALFADAVLCAIGTPAALTGVALTFQVSDDGGTTYKALYDTDGTAVSVTMAASRYIRLNPSLFVGFSHLKLVSGSAEAANRTFNLIFAAI